MKIYDNGSNTLQIYDSGFVRVVARSIEGMEPVYLPMSLITAIHQATEGTYIDVHTGQIKGPFLNLSEEECETLMREVMLARQKESSW